MGWILFINTSNNTSDIHEQGGRKMCVCLSVRDELLLLTRKYEGINFSWHLLYLLSLFAFSSQNDTTVCIYWL